MAGDSFMTMNDTPLYGKYNDPAASKVAGKVAMGRFPLGPSTTKKGVAWRAAWFWAIPKAIAPNRRSSRRSCWSGWERASEVQRDIFKATAGIPPISKIQEALAKEEPLFQQIKATLLDAPYHIVPAYYFKQSPEVHVTFSDVWLGQGAHRQARGHRQDAVGGRAEAHERHDAVGVRRGFAPLPKPPPQGSDCAGGAGARTRNDRAPCGPGPECPESP